MSASSITLRGRAAAEALMVDTCTVQRKTGETTDDELGTVTPIWSTVYSGNCKVKQQSAAASPTDVGQAERLIGQLELHIPTSATGVSSDDLVTITASVLDADLVGRTFRIRGVSHKSFLTARRFALIEVTS